VDWDVTHLFFGFQILKGPVYILFELTLDILGLMVVVGLGMAFYRRYVARPSRLREFPEKALARDDTYVLVMLAFIVVSGYLTEGLRLAVTQSDWAPWSPIGNAVAAAFLALGDPTNQTLHLIIWTMHVLSAFIFLASLPLKLFHIISLPQYLLSFYATGWYCAPRVDGGMV
jgi:nitrate reductase gamma subunit